jgi:hypothetical protein
MKSEIPTQISEEIVSANALIGDIWRLACRKIIKDSEKESNTKEYQFKYKYEELWLLAEQTCKTESNKCSIKEVILTYHAACQDYLGIFDQQARRLGNLTITRPLRPHPKCRISAPKWKKNKIAPGKKYKFSCRMNPQKIIWTQKIHVLPVDIQ